MSVCVADVNDERKSRVTTVPPKSRPVTLLLVDTCMQVCTYHSVKIVGCNIMKYSLHKLLFLNEKNLLKT